MCISELQAIRFEKALNYIDSIPWRVAYPFGSNFCGQAKCKLNEEVRGRCCRFVVLHRMGKSGEGTRIGCLLFLSAITWLCCSPESALTDPARPRNIPTLSSLKRVFLCFSKDAIRWRPSQVGWRPSLSITRSRLFSFSSDSSLHI